jgi:hypothetical protein
MWSAEVSLPSKSSTLIWEKKEGFLPLPQSHAAGMLMALLHWVCI